MSGQFSQEQENIMEALDCEWDDVVLQFGGQMFGEIKTELDKMFWYDVDANANLAQEIFDELEYQQVDL